MSSQQSVELGKGFNAFTYGQPNRSKTNSSSNSLDHSNPNTNITIADSPNSSDNQHIVGNIKDSSFSSSSFCHGSDQSSLLQRQKQKQNFGCFKALKYIFITLTLIATLLSILTYCGIIHKDEIFPFNKFNNDDMETHKAYLNANGKNANNNNNFDRSNNNDKQRDIPYQQGQRDENNNISIYSPKTVNVIQPPKNQQQKRKQKQEEQRQQQEQKHHNTGGSNSMTDTKMETEIEAETATGQGMDEYSTFVPLSTWSNRRFLEQSPEGWQYDDSIQMLKKIDKHFQESYTHYSNQGEVLVPVTCSIPVPLYERNKDFQEKGHPVAKEYRGTAATRQELYTAMERDAVKYRQYLTATGKHVGSWLEPATDIQNYRRLFVDVDDADKEDRNRHTRGERGRRGEYMDKKEQQHQGNYNHGSRNEKVRRNDQEEGLENIYNADAHTRTRRDIIDIEIDAIGMLQDKIETRDKMTAHKEHEARHLKVGEGYYFEEDGKPYFMYKDTTYFIEPSPTGPNPWPEGVQPVDAVGDDGYFWIYREMGEQAAFMQCFLKIEAVKYGPYFQEYMRFGTFQTPFYDY